MSLLTLWRFRNRSRYVTLRLRRTSRFREGCRIAMYPTEIVSRWLSRSRRVKAWVEHGAARSTCGATGLPAEGARALGIYSSLRSSRFDGTTRPARFALGTRCSHPLLKVVWQIGQRSVSVPSYAQNRCPGHSLSAPGEYSRCPPGPLAGSTSTIGRAIVTPSCSS